MSVEQAYERLSRGFSGRLRLNEPLARHTTFRIGGPAALFAECDTLTSLTSLLAALEEEGVEWTVLGRGSNILASDAGYDGAVILLGQEFRHHSLDGTLLKAGAGMALAAIVQESFGRGLTGLEFAVGIPGTLGGAVRMNAGTRDEWIGSLVECLTVYRPGSGLMSVRGGDVAWGYRATGIPKSDVILEACLRLEPGDEWTIRQRMEALLTRRKKSQPLSLPNAGSIFVNPEGYSAGRLIEESGLKGRRVGGAEISEVHANFIVNRGGASAADVIELIREVTHTVEEAHGIELRPEIRFLGSFDFA